MSVTETLTLISAQMKILLPCLYVVVGVTCLLLIPLNLLGKRLWVNKKSFMWLGLFFDLSTLDMMRLASAWVRLWVVVTFLCSKEPLVHSQYWLFLICALIHVILAKGILDSLGKCLWSVLQTMGLVSASLICGYLILLEAPLTYWIAYALLCVFMILFSIYLFLLDVNTISLGRNANIGRTNPKQN